MVGIVPDDLASVNWLENQRQDAKTPGKPCGFAFLRLGVSPAGTMTHENVLSALVRV